MSRVRIAAWVTPGLVGIVLATFLSDVGHEMATGVLPLYLTSIGLGAAALGAMEGAADLAFSLAKLAGGWVGHRTRRKRPLAALGYLVTALGTGAIALTQSVAALASVRSAAWMGRGFRSPLRDFMLADEVGPTHFGRAYGVERAADMLGAVAGPLLAAVLVSVGLPLRSVILLSVAPALLAAVSFYSLTRDRETVTGPTAVGPAASGLPRSFWLFTGGVALFGLGDFSRTFLIFLAATTLGPGWAGAALPAAMLLYAAHNAVSALAAYPAGALGDRLSRRGVLTAGYALGVLTNVLLAWSTGRPAVLLAAVGLSGIYIAVEETLEKATAAELLPREQRSLGLGVLASANAVGDMLSSIGVGLLLSRGYPQAAFLIPAGCGLAGTVWMACLRGRPAYSSAS